MYGRLYRTSDREAHNRDATSHSKTPNTTRGIAPVGDLCGDHKYLLDPNDLHGMRPLLLLQDLPQCHTEAVTDSEQA